MLSLSRNSGFALFNSFKHSVRNVLSKENTGELLIYHGTVASPLRFPSVRDLQQNLAHSEHEKPNIKRHRFLLRLSDMVSILSNFWKAPERYIQRHQTPKSVLLIISVPKNVFQNLTGQ